MDHEAIMEQARAAAAAAALMITEKYYGPQSNDISPWDRSSSNPGNRESGGGFFPTQRSRRYEYSGAAGDREFDRREMSGSTAYEYDTNRSRNISGGHYMDDGGGGIRHGMQRPRSRSRSPVFDYSGVEVMSSIPRKEMLRSSYDDAYNHNLPSSHSKKEMLRFPRLIRMVGKFFEGSESLIAEDIRRHAHVEPTAIRLVGDQTGQFHFGYVHFKNGFDANDWIKTKKSGKLCLLDGSEAIIAFMSDEEAKVTQWKCRDCGIVNFAIHHGCKKCDGCVDDEALPCPDVVEQHRSTSRVSSRGESGRGVMRASHSVTSPLSLRHGPVDHHQSRSRNTNANKNSETRKSSLNVIQLSHLPRRMTAKEGETAILETLSRFAINIPIKSIKLVKLSSHAIPLYEHENKENDKRCPYDSSIVCHIKCNNVQDFVALQAALNALRRTFATGNNFRSECCDPMRIDIVSDETENRNSLTDSLMKRSENRSSNLLLHTSTPRNSKTKESEECKREDIELMSNYSASLYATNDVEKQRFLEYYRAMYKSGQIPIDQAQVSILREAGKNGSSGGGVGVPETSAVDISSTLEETQTTGKQVKVNVHGVEYLRYPPPILSTFAFDAPSGLYYDSTTSLHYDPKSKHFINKRSGVHLIWDASHSTYLPVGADTPLKVASAMEKWADSVNKFQSSISQKNQADKGVKNSVPKHSNNGKTEPTEPPSIPPPETRSEAPKTLTFPPPGRASSVNSILDDGLSGVDRSQWSDWNKLACLLCRRMFQSTIALKRHNDESELHKGNMMNRLKMKSSTNINGFTNTTTTSTSASMISSSGSNTFLKQSVSNVQRSTSTNIEKSQMLPTCLKCLTKHSLSNMTICPARFTKCFNCNITGHYKHACVNATTKMMSSNASTSSFGQSLPNKLRVNPLHRKVM